MIVALTVTHVAPLVALAVTVGAVIGVVIGVSWARRSLVPPAVAAVEQALHDRLQRDELTGLATRNHFVGVVAEQLATTGRRGVIAVVRISLDRFKQINDSMGHAAANLVLSAVAERLDAAARQFGATAARTAGDEFALVDATLVDATEALARAESLLASVRAPIAIDEATIFVTASVGLAVAESDEAIPAEELLRRADIATHRAKVGGRDRVAVFDDSMQAAIAARVDIEHALHGAVERNEMRLYQQPIVDIASGRLSGFEALMRWERSPGRVLAPSEFMGIAEETGLINEFGAWALREALRTLRHWVDEGLVGPDATMSVNVSPRQIADPGFAGVVRDALAATGTRPEQLWLEITETMMIEEPELAERTLREVCAMGVRIALDDFGTGYSSLSLLRHFPIGRIKIDRAFINGITDRAYDRSLVRTLVTMAQSMALDLVAEGIETIEQLQALREMGCDKAQGYLISRPAPPEAIRSTLAAMGELANLAVFRTPGGAAAPPSPQVATPQP